MAEFKKYTIVYKLKGEQTVINVDEIRFIKARLIASDDYLFAHREATSVLPGMDFTIPAWDIIVIYKKIFDNGVQTNHEVIYNIREVTAKALKRLSKKENDIIKRDKED